MQIAVVNNEIALSQPQSTKIATTTTVTGSSNTETINGVVESYNPASNQYINGNSNGLGGSVSGGGQSGMPINYGLDIIAPTYAADTITGGIIDIAGISGVSNLNPNDVVSMDIYVQFGNISLLSNPISSYKQISSNEFTLTGTMSQINSDLTNIIYSPNSGGWDDSLSLTLSSASFNQPFTRYIPIVVKSSTNEFSPLSTITTLTPSMASSFSNDIGDTMVGSNGINNINMGSVYSSVLFNNGENTINSGTLLPIGTVSPSNNPLMNMIFVGLGNNVINLTTNVNNSVSLGIGANTVFSSAGNNNIQIDSGINNDIILKNGNNTITGGLGYGTINQSGGNILFYGLPQDGGNNILDLSGGMSTISLMSGNNTINTGLNNSSDIALGLGDNILSINGSDTILTGLGTNMIDNLGTKSMLRVGMGFVIVKQMDASTIEGGDSSMILNGDNNNLIFGSLNGFDTINLNNSNTVNLSSNSSITTQNENSIKFYGSGDTLNGGNNNIITINTLSNNDSIMLGNSNDINGYINSSYLSLGGFGVVSGVLNNDTIKASSDSFNILNNSIDGVLNDSIIGNNNNISLFQNENIQLTGNGNLINVSDSFNTISSSSNILSIKNTSSSVLDETLIGRFNSVNLAGNVNFSVNGDSNNINIGSGLDNILSSSNFIDFNNTSNNINKESIFGGNNNITLSGGLDFFSNGNNTITASLGNDTIHASNNVINLNNNISSPFFYTILGDNNSIRLNGNNFISISGSYVFGNTTINAISGDQNIQSNNENIKFIGGSSDATIYSNNGSLTTFGGNNVTEYGGTAGNNNLTGGSGVSILNGGGNNDVLNAMNSQYAILQSSPGNTTLIGSSAENVIFNGSNNPNFSNQDIIQLGSNGDTINPTGTTYLTGTSMQETRVNINSSNPTTLFLQNNNYTSIYGNNGFLFGYKL